MLISSVEQGFLWLWFLGCTTSLNTLHSFWDCCEMIDHKDLFEHSYANLEHVSSRLFYIIQLAQKFYSLKTKSQTKYSVVQAVNDLFICFLKNFVFIKLRNPNWSGIGKMSLNSSPEGLINTLFIFAVENLIANQNSQTVKFLFL